MSTLARTMYFIRTQTASCLSYMIKGSSIRLSGINPLEQKRGFIFIALKNALKKKENAHMHFTVFFQEYVIRNK